MVDVQPYVNVDIYSKHNELILKLISCEYEEQAINRLLNVYLVKGGNLTVIIPNEDDPNQEVYLQVNSVEDLWREMEKFKI